MIYRTLAAGMKPGSLSLVLVAALSLGALAAAVPAAARAAASPAAANLIFQQQPPSQALPQSSPPVTEYSLPPDKYRQAVNYSRAQNWLYFGGFAYGLVVLLLVLGWRLAPRYRDWAERATSHRLGQAAIFVPLLFLTTDVLSLPITVLGQWVQRHYQQSVQGWGSWAWDWTKAELISFVIGAFLLWILYAAIRRSPLRWWFYFWLAALPILCFLIFISPYVLAPLFNKFVPLSQRDPALTAQLVKVTEQAGRPILPERMFLMEASRKVNSVDAYVTGFGASKRVVVWDTTIRDMTTPEITFVFGHEMGHYVLHHVVWGLALGAAALLVFLRMGYQALGWSLRRWGARWAIRGVDDWASLPALLLWLSIFGFLASPLTNGASRHFEHEADRFGLEVTHGIFPNSSQVAARAFQILGEVDLADPHPSPLIKFWLYNHPPVDERVQFALHYDPWTPGRHPRYIQ